MSLKRSVFNAKRSLLLRSSEQMYRRLLQDERLEPEQLTALQAKRASQHARFAMEHTRFYRELYTDAGFTLKDLEDPASFTELPVVEKSDIRERFDDFRSTEATKRNSRLSTTGGSTGEPLKILRDLRTPTRTLEWRLFRWWGIHPSDDIAVVYRQLRDRQAKVIHDVQWWPSRRIQLDPFHMDRDQIDAFFARWQRVRPALVIGYAGGIAELASQLEITGRQVAPPRAVAVTAAPITEAQRRSIEATFHAPVYDHYRSAEVPWIAGECAAHQGLHTFADVRVIEVLDRNNRQVAPGTMGEVVASDLTNRVFPIIRYRLGDRTSPVDGVCPCGVTLPRIQAVVGRVSDVVRLPDGQVVPGESLTGTFRSAIGIVRQFQVHQHADYSIVVRCVLEPGANHDQEALEQVLERVRGQVRGKVPVHLEVVGRIPHIGGKIRYIASDVQPTPEFSGP